MWIAARWPKPCWSGAKPEEFAGPVSDKLLNTNRFPELSENGPDHEE